jgi:cell pole-organizing protein PopZ
MGNDRKMNDMSVEDILKSIRGIIDKRDDKNDKEDDILELTDMVDSPDENVPFDLNEEIEEENLISGKLASETSSALKQFAEKAKSAVKEYKKSKIPTLDELVIDILRPQLKQWLDDNLPSLVKELVEKEIKNLVPKEGE